MTPTGQRPPLQRLPQWGSTLAPRLALAAVLLLTALIYAPFLGNASLGNYFWLDDVVWTAGPLQTSTPWTWALLPNAIIPYRPLTATLFVALAPLTACVPWPYRTLGLALHLLNSVLAWRLARRILGAEWPALLAVALWAVHPSLRWSVLWIADLAGLLGTTAVLLGMLAFLHWQTHRGARWYALALVAFLAAVLAKETLAGAVVIIPLLAWARGTPRPLRTSLPFITLTALALLPIAVAYSLRPASGTLDLFAWHTLANWVRAGIFFVWPFIAPNDVNGFHLPGLANDHFALVLVAAPFIALALGALWRAHNRHAWMLALASAGALAPVSLRPFVLLPFGGRYLYLPALGGLLLLALGAHYGVRHPTQRSALAVAAAALVAACALYSPTQQVWMRDPRAPQALLERITWSSLLGCPLPPSAVPSVLAANGLTDLTPALAAPLPPTDDRFYLIKLITHASARALTRDTAGATADFATARSLALRGDLDTRDGNSGYYIPQATLIAYIDMWLATLVNMPQSAGPPIQRVSSPPTRSGDNPAGEPARPRRGGGRGAERPPPTP